MKLREGFARKKLTTTVIQTQHGRLDAASLTLCMDVIQAGGIVIFPTDTVYGMGCSAFNFDSVMRLYELKGRYYSKPIPILISSSLQLDLVARDIPLKAEVLMDHFWPGPLTLVFKTNSRLLVATRGKDTIAVRVPDHGVVKQLLDGSGLPMATTSANLSGHAAPTTAADAKQKFMGKVDVIIDGGACPMGVESSVVDATHYPFLVLREAAIPKTVLWDKVCTA